MGLQFTGERLVPGEISKDSQMYVEHITRYMFAEQYVKDKIVLDAGCGCGYGLDFLSQYVSRAIGIDISKDAIDCCNAYYKKDKIDFYQMDCCNMSFSDETFDVVISFEFIEHIQDQNKFLKEANRVLKLGGIFIVSTPNKQKYANADNPYHVLTLDISEFNEKLKQNFNKVMVYGQKNNSSLLLDKKLYFLQKEMSEINYKLDHLPIFFIKSLVPKIVRCAIKQCVNLWSSQRDDKGNNTQNLCRFPMTINDIEISRKNIIDSEYLLGVCEK